LIKIDTANAPDIQISSLIKEFDSGVRAVDDVDLAIASGEFLSIVGPSGCGKSTILRLVAGLTGINSGQISIGGDPVVEPRQDVALMFQSPTLLPWKTALQNALIPVALRYRRVPKAKELEARELLNMLGLKGFEHTYPRHLSGGMQQRVALGRLLMTGADVLLLDEPFAAVDELTRERLNVELMRVHAATGKTIVLVTHNLSEATLLGDRVIVMSPRPGRISMEIDVPFDRPRLPSMVTTSEFQLLVERARRRLELDEAARGQEVVA
jgi:NitT/TauT family transport system ATP-binding protein